MLSKFINIPIESTQDSRKNAQLSVLARYALGVLDNNFREPDLISFKIIYRVPIHNDLFIMLNKFDF